MTSTTQRVPEHTAAHVNERIRLQTERSIAFYARQGGKAIDRRLQELDEEWDIERLLEANAGSASLFGFLMGTFVNRKWYLLTGLVGGFLLQHAIEGWCPPLPVFRRLGFRTSEEIEIERRALLEARDEEPEADTQDKVAKKRR